MNTETPQDAEERAPGRIFTFYSYKGGTGRSMALANVAWILASNGHRVLAIDWDLEAPGLHRYFRPFLSDPELLDSPGLIDFFVHFTEAACLQARATATTSASVPTSERAWFYDRADLLRYSLPLDYKFPQGGTLDLVGAGQQGPSYGARVNSFQWKEFYEKLGGGVFLEAVKAELRCQYDYVLIDSRTGLSDTSGLCTVQMPDELVVCFTFNRQSMYGAAAIAESADAQRRLPNGAKGLRIWPVPTRVELQEKQKLETARLTARECFAPFLWHIPQTLRPSYWGEIEVLYFAYYAYEEVLATIADTPKQTASLLNSMERLTARLTERRVTEMPVVPQNLRTQLLSRYLPTKPPATVPGIRAGRFYISYTKRDIDEATVSKFAKALERRLGPSAVFWDALIPIGAKWQQALDEALEKAEYVIFLVGPRWQESTFAQTELHKAQLMTTKILIPVGVNGVEWDKFPPELQERRGFILSEKDFDQSVGALADMLMKGEASMVAESSAAIDVDDPQRGQWGGKPTRAGRQLTAVVSEESSGWFSIQLQVISTDARPLEGDVEFHLHPSFRKQKIRVPVEQGVAKLVINVWGSFTVGAVADNGKTPLELNLAELREAPDLFRKR